jgi:hypothetical protein
VATVGISPEEAREIKNSYRALRDQALAERPEIALVDLAIEPLDEIEVVASAAKANGILAVAKKSLHFELPAYEIMASRPQRKFYTSVLSNLISRVASQVFARRSSASR